MLFDFSGNGESEGDFANLTLTGQVEDLTAVTDYCLQLGFHPVVTLGRSFGGSTAICHGALDNRIGGVCTWAAPVNLYELFLSSTVGDLPAEDEATITMSGSGGIIDIRKAFFTDILKYDICAMAAAITPRPLLIIQGRRDEVVPPEEALKIYRCAGTPKTLHWIDRGDHQLSGHYREVWSAVINWLKVRFQNNI
jgi:putative redox protein